MMMRIIILLDNESVTIVNKENASSKIDKIFFILSIKKRV